MSSLAPSGAEGHVPGAMIGGQLGARLASGIRVYTPTFFRTKVSLRGPFEEPLATDTNAEAYA